MTFAVRKHATGNRAKAQCARCGMVIPYKRLTLDGYKKNLWVCPDCYDPDHPQEHPVPTADAEALHHAQPLLDSGAAASSFADNLGTGGAFTINGSLADALPPVGATWGRAVTFDGMNDDLNRGSALSGAQAGKEGTVSFWLKQVGDELNYIRDTDGEVQFQGYGVSIYTNSSGGINFRLQEAATTGSILWIGGASPGSASASKGWSHVLAAWNLTTPEAHVYVGDVDVKFDSIGPTIGNIAYTQTENHIGRPAPGHGSSSLRLNGDLFDYWEAHEFIDISVEANRRKFITPDRKPVDLGADGTNPGVTPIIFMSARGLGPSDSVPQLSDVLGDPTFGGGT